jgi:Carboxypeptidase regulatory-like domain
MRKTPFLLAGCVTAALAFAAPAFAQGTIEGHVKLTAAAPVNPTIPMGADPNCLQINAGKRIKQEYVLRAADGGLANVFATLRGNLPASGPATPPAMIDQRGCTYHPRIQGARVGQILEVRNSDATLHNIHSLSTKGNDFNTGQPMAGMVFKYPLKSEEVMLHVKCDVHPWMTGYIGVVKHPFYAVSDATGTFRIANVPAGKQTITVWHEKYGPLTQTVDVKAGATTTVSFNYTGTEKPNPSVAGLQIEEVSLPMEATAVELVAPAAR